MWVKFKFQTPDYMYGVYCGMWTQVFVEQKKLLRQQSSVLIVYYIVLTTFLAHEEFHLPLLEVSRVVGREGT
jgi:hypothetical protein